MTSSEASRFAGDLSEKSKHWANYKRHPRGSVQIQCADKAETLFFYWLWRKE